MRMLNRMFQNTGKGQSLWVLKINAKYKGGVTPIGGVSRAATTVKMQSNGQGTSWGLVKQSRGVLGPIFSIGWSRGMAKILHMCS